MKRLTVLLACAGLVLASCGDKKTPATGTSATPAAPAASGPPPRKPGLWQQTMTAPDSPPVVMSICLDAATDAKMSALGAQTTAEQCSENTFSRGLDGSMTFHSTCNMGTGGMIRSTGRATGDFNSEYTMTIDAETTGAAVPQMNRKTTMTVAAKWMGACPAGVAPGDMVMPGGMKINMTGAPGAPAAPR